MQLTGTPPSPESAGQAWLSSHNGAHHEAVASQNALAPQMAPPVQSSKFAVLPAMRQVKNTPPPGAKAVASVEQLSAPQSVPKGVQLGEQVPTGVPPRPAAHL